MFSIAQFIRLIQKNIYILIGVPIVLAALVFYFTRNEAKTYISKTTLYTGIASGASIVSQEEKNVDFFGVKIVFDNFINIINSRKTMEETGLELFAQNLMLKEPNTKYLSNAHYNELHNKVPQEIKDLVVDGDIMMTKLNMTDYMRKSDTNYIYKMVSLNHPHYSVEAISKVNVKRINNSDLVTMEYNNNDQGITQQTLIILTRVFLERYKDIKENQSSDVVKYFEEQVALGAERLRNAEDRLLQFNQKNNIINYYEQSKYIADQKEKLDVKIQETRMEMVAADASVSELESKLQHKDKIKLSSGNIVGVRNELSKISSRITYIETTDDKGEQTESLAKLKRKSKKLKDKLAEEIINLQSYSQTKEGLDINEVLKDWLKNVIKYEENKARMAILSERKVEFQKIYQRFAPLGATLKRIEREIGVAEEAYLSLLYSLSLAKLKQQNIEMSTVSKVVDQPYYPIKAKASKRKVLIVAAGLIGFIFTLALLIILEYLDSTLKNPDRASRIIGLSMGGVYPKLGKYSKKINFDFIKRRLIELTAQDIKLSLLKSHNRPKKVVIFSSEQLEGKTVITRDLCEMFHSFGNKVIYLNFEKESEIEEETEALYDKGTYNTEQNFFEVKNLTDLHEADYDSYDYVFMELPSILHHPYPVNLLQEVDQCFMVVRANRTWNKADIKSLETIKQVTKSEPKIILNGVVIDVLPNILGELPKKRSRIRRILKKLVTMQVKSRYTLKK